MHENSPTKGVFYNLFGFLFPTVHVSVQNEQYYFKAMCI